MKFEVIKATQLGSEKWSGGTTTQLFIFPPDATYQNRNFDFRLSTASVETATSTFTKLPGVSRHLMILEGEVAIKHEGHHECRLQKFDIDSFEGSWITTAAGMCKDFNLMTKASVRGRIAVAVIEPTIVKTYQLNLNLEWLFLYVNDGNIQLELNQTKTNLQRGDLFLLKNIVSGNLLIKSDAKSEVVITEIIK